MDQKQQRPGLVMQDINGFGRIPFFQVGTSRLTFADIAILYVTANPLLASQVAVRMRTVHIIVYPATKNIIDMYHDIRVAAKQGHEQYQKLLSPVVIRISSLPGLLWTYYPYAGLGQSFEVSDNLSHQKSFRILLRMLSAMLSACFVPLDSGDSLPGLLKVMCICH